MRTADEFLIGVLESAKLNLMHYTELLPVLFLLEGEEVQIIGLPDFGPTSNLRRIQLALIGRTHPKVDAAVLVMDAWTVIYHAEAGETEAELRERSLAGGMPSKSPDRQECIVANYKDLDDYTRGVTVRYTRLPKGKFQFNEPEWTDNAEGLLDALMVGIRTARDRSK